MIETIPHVVKLDDEDTTALNLMPHDPKNLRLTTPYCTN